MQTNWRWVILRDGYCKSTLNAATHRTFPFWTVRIIPIAGVNLPLLFWVSLCLIDMSVWADSWARASQNERQKAVYTWGRHVICLDERHGSAHLWATCSSWSSCSREINTMLTIHLCGMTFSTVEQHRNSCCPWGIMAQQKTTHSESVWTEGQVCSNHSTSEWYQCNRKPLKAFL